MLTGKHVIPSNVRAGRHTHTTGELRRITKQHAQLPASPGNAAGIMPKTDSSAGRAARPGDRLPEGEPLPDISLCERLIDDGIVAADGRGSTVDHFTARRLVIRPRERVYAQG
jgi:hypothetical protein